MQAFAWNSEKNERLRQERGITFEDIVLNIQLGNEIDIFDHPNQERYPGQKISVVLVEGYAYLVPFVESDEEIFLKTIIPSRKATKQYLIDRDDE
ncbi:BrnT family toxin [Nodosilinea sp. LEGE 07298]|uniref:BrnT family toxin n=1 Tax=Nodosilinea sp. LEGE 07298 TaxID=2777970 RepID=UPI00188284A5|nr:BrnT family toxin [Nodosilinea sp. LEGE 07298]MBE9113380.1 BrnT family toxin [Nodosilinea sp. LEGE 07298]